MALTSPGVEVSVINESFYVPSDAGTTPLFIVASGQDKLPGSGSGTASGTTTANADTVYLLSSQRELTETFGDPKFYTDASGNSLNGYELNVLQGSVGSLDYICCINFSMNSFQVHSKNHFKDYFQFF